MNISLLTFFVAGAILFFICDMHNFVALKLERRNVGCKKGQIFHEAHEPRQRTSFVPKDSVLVGNGRLLWCPNAKVGTTTMYHILRNEFGEFGGSQQHRCFHNCSHSAWKLMKTANGRQKVLNATSFTIVRNPWDRIRSAYESKIKTRFHKCTYFHSYIHYYSNYFRVY